MSSLTGLDSAVLAFDATHSHLAIASGDGRVRLFNVDMQRLSADITQDLSSARGSQVATEIYSCMAWGGKGEHQRLLFLGSFTGAVCCYDIARAEVRWMAPGPVDGSIAALATGPSGALLVVGKTGTASILDLSTGNVLSRWNASRHALSAAVMLPGDSGGALVAGSILTLHDASSGSQLHKWTGHATPIVALAVTPDGAYCCSAAQGERCIAVWSMATSPNGKLKHKSAIAQLNIDEPAVDISIGSASGGGFHVAAVTSRGALCLFECSAAGNDASAVSVRQWGASNTKGGGRVLCASIEAADAHGVNIVLASGSTVKPHFQKIRIDNSTKAVVEIDVAVESQQGLLLQDSSGAGNSNKTKASVHTATVIGADEGVVFAGKQGGNKRGAAAADLQGSDIDDMDAEDQVDEGPTFAERIAALRDGGIGGNTTDTVTTGTTAAAAAGGPLKADSLAVLLSQALQSGDKVLLERCLAVRNEEIINKTVQGLAPADAAAFLRTAVQRMQSAPVRGEQLALWIRAILLYHTAYLSGVAGAQGTLGYLYQLIEARLASYQPLMALSGRLDLVLANAQRAMGENYATKTGAEEDEQMLNAYGGGRPLITVEVGSDGGVEVEDAFAAADLSDDSNGEWDSDEDIDNDDDDDEDEEEEDEGEESEEF